MGNIFKTLGLDDLARKFLPGIGNTVADVMTNLPLGQKSGPGANSGNMINTETGKSPGRISNEDYQFNQDLLDSSNTREATRQNEFNTLTNQTNINNQSAFLEGLAPAQANAHNTFQDSTYQAGIDRETAGIKSQASALGMSPWELTGNSTGGGGGAIPPGLSQTQQTRSDGSGFLSAATPLAVAKMQNDTQLKTAQIQADTSRYVADQQTNKGGLPRAQQAQSAAQTILTGAQTGLTGAQTANTKQQTATGRAQESLTWSQAAVAENSIILNAISTLAQLLPSTEINTGIFKTTEKHGYEALLNLTKSLGDSASLPQAVGQYVKNLPPKQWSELEKELIQMSSILAKGATGGMSLINKGVNFLKYLGK